MAGSIARQVRIRDEPLERLGVLMIEITAIFDRERLRFENADGDAIIGEARIIGDESSSILTIKGKAERGELQQHLSYRFYGHWTEYHNKRTGKLEKQFAFKTFVASQPHGRAGVITYLKKAGEGNNIGQATATQIWEKFGPDSVRILREAPEVVASAIKRLSLDECVAASKWLKEKQDLEDCTIELASLFDGRGFPKSLPGAVVKTFGNKAASLIKRDPYQLMHFRGCGFKRCDNLYLELGLDPARLRRQAFCAWHTVASNSDGHTWFPAQFAADGVRAMVGGTEAKPARAIKLATRICKLNKDTHGALGVIREAGGAVVESGTNVFVAEGRKAWCEAKVAEIVAERMADDSFQFFWPNAEYMENISEHQRDKLSECLDGSICILGGSPGTGKTYTAARLIASVASNIGFDGIAVAAPTGKAAVRITQAMQDYGLPLKARTWHSLLGMADSGEGFKHDEADPWPFQLIVGDESSMIDTNLMSSILRATARNCAVLLIGDVNQLPPVGHGAPLRDLIAAGVPYGELREIKRNSGGIVEACAAIRDGQPWEPGDNLILNSSAGQLDAVNDELTIAKNCGLDPVWDCQVLVAVNEKSPLSRKAVNQFLQAEWNPNAKVAGTPFRVADKVVCLKNSDFSLIEDDAGKAEQGDKARIMNGELGKVIEIAEKYLLIRVDDPYRLIRVPRAGGESDEGAGCNWDLGYGLSCHKSQGSEWPVVVVLLDEYPGAKMVCSREWLYTGISRAKSRCVLIGKKSTADQMCRRVAIGKRKTFLKELVLRNLAVAEMAGM
jgi:exodeoxyribonuclease V alpha subunit